MEISKAELFARLCGLEYRLLMYIHEIQGLMAAPVNFKDAAAFLKVQYSDIRRAIKRLVEAKALIAEGENFQVNEAVLKKEKQ